MRTLTKHSFSGSYNKKVDGFNNPSIEICGENGNIFLQLWVDSGTYKFARKLSEPDTKDLINQLENLPEQASKLMITLNDLSN